MLAPAHFRGLAMRLLVDLGVCVAVIVFAYSYLLLMHVGRFDPVVAWAANAWAKADYGSALLRLRLFSWRDRRAPFLSFLLSSANLPERAYAVATQAKLPETDLEEPSYNLDFAAGGRRWRAITGRSGQQSTCAWVMPCDAWDTSQPPSSIGGRREGPIRRDGRGTRRRGNSNALPLDVAEAYPGYLWSGVAWLVLRD